MRTNKPDGYLVGLDIGGTSTRALLAGVDGQRLATGSAGGANPNSHPPEQAAAEVAAALRAALADVDPAEVRAGVIGMAGYSKLTDPEVHRLFTEAWHGTGLRCPMRAVADSEAAFAAGTTEPAGIVAVAGTGSVVARIAERRLAGTIGGHGWLLGDEGSAFWLGREAVRSTLRALEGRVSWGGSLGSAVLRAALGEVDDADRRRCIELLLTSANSRPPIELARYAPLVTEHALAGDPAAADIVERAVAALVETVQAAQRPGEQPPIVLIGSLVGAGNPVGDGLRATLAEVGFTDVHTATDGAAGAAWLAALDLLGDAALPLHPRLLRT